MSRPLQSDNSRLVRAPGVNFSQSSHRQTERHRPQASLLDTPWTLTCGYGFPRTGRTGCSDLRMPDAQGATAPLPTPGLKTWIWVSSPLAWTLLMARRRDPVGTRHDAHGKALAAPIAP